MKVDVSKLTVPEVIALHHELKKYIQDLEGTFGGAVPKHNGSSLKGTKVKPKYRGPKGETWAGRGAQPVWLVALLKKGKKLEQYRIKG